ncbi:MAG: hypothetical protein ABSE73_22730 [Planctomycetota bacterium]
MNLGWTFDKKERCDPEVPKLPAKFLYLFIGILARVLDANSWPVSDAQHCIQPQAAIRFFVEKPA